MYSIRIPLVWQSFKTLRTVFLKGGEFVEAVRSWESLRIDLSCAQVKTAYAKPTRPTRVTRFRYVDWLDRPDNFTDPPTPLDLVNFTRPDPTQPT